MNRITVIGAGFGALNSVRELRRRDSAAEITLIAPRAELIYLPSLVWVPSGLRKGDDLRIALRAFFETHRVRHVAAGVIGLENGGRRVFFRLFLCANKEKSTGAIFRTSPAGERSMDPPNKEARNLCLLSHS